MNLEQIAVDKAEARRLYRKYKEHRAYSQPIDWEIQRAYQLLASGNVIIKALESVVRGGLDEAGLPKLALGNATAKTCHLERHADGSFSMAPDRWRSAPSQTFAWPAGSFGFPRDSFPLNWKGNARVERSDHQAQTPIIPLHLRPKRALAAYHVLWEAEWQRIPPRDPYLLRRIGKSDLWLVVAHWDLTDVERAALATRVRS